MALRWRQGTSAVWLLLFCIGWMIGCPQIQADDMAHYRRQLQQCRLFLVAAGQAERMAVGTGRPWASEAIRQLRPSSGGLIRDKKHVSAYYAIHSALYELYTTSLSRAPEGLDAVVNSLDTRWKLLQPAPAPPPMAMAHAEEAVAAELKRAAYQVGALAAFRQKIDELIERFLEGLLPKDFDGDGITFVMTILLMGATGTALGLLVVRLMRMRRRQTPTADTDTAEWEETPADTASCLQLAEQAARDGRYDDALRWLFRAALQSLLDDGRLEDRPGCTNWEMVRMLERGFPQTAGAFRRMVMLFDNHIYGARPVTAERYREGLDLLNALRQGEQA